MSASKTSNTPVVTCPYCNKGPKPAKVGMNLCSGCSQWFEVKL